MKASELVEVLNKLIFEHGDLNVSVRDFVEGNDFPMGKVVFQPQYDAGFRTNEAGEKESIVGEAAFYIE